MDERVAELILTADATLLDGVKAIDRGAVGIALVCDGDQRVLGTLTDGDVRRALIAGAKLGDPVATTMHGDFTRVAPAATRSEVLDLMLALGLRHIVVVDEAGRLAGLHLMQELIGHRRRPNWAVLMAGGRGSRLMPLTEDVPKPMIKVAGRPILERLILHLVGHGVETVFLSVNYLSSVIEDHFGDGSDFECDITYLRETDPLGTAGSLSLLPEVPSEPVLVMNGDLVTEADLGSLLDFHGEGRYGATVSLRPHAVHVPFGVADVAGHRLRLLVEKPTSTVLVNAGIYVLSPEVVKRVEPGVPTGMPDVIAECLANDIPVGAHVVEGDWLDVGRHDELRKARGES